MKKFAVITTFCFDDGRENDCNIRNFATEEDAKQFLKTGFENEVRVDTEENDWDIESEISPDGMFAKIIAYFDDGKDVVCWFVEEIDE